MHFIKGFLCSHTLSFIVIWKWTNCCLETFPQIIVRFKYADSELLDIRTPQSGWWSQSVPGFQSYVFVQFPSLYDTCRAPFIHSNQGIIYAQIRNCSTLNIYNYQTIWSNNVVFKFGNMHLFKLNSFELLKLVLLFTYTSDTGYLLENNGQNSEKLVYLSTWYHGQCSSLSWDQHVKLWNIVPIFEARKLEFLRDEIA